MKPKTLFWMVSGYIFTTSWLSVMFILSVCNYQVPSKMFKFALSQPGLFLWTLFAAVIGFGLLIFFQHEMNEQKKEEVEAAKNDVRRGIENGKAVYEMKIREKVGHEIHQRENELKEATKVHADWCRSYATAREDLKKWKEGVERQLEYILHYMDKFAPKRVEKIRENNPELARQLDNDDAKRVKRAEQTLAEVRSYRMPPLEDKDNKKAATA